MATLKVDDVFKAKNQQIPEKRQILEGNITNRKFAYLAKIFGTALRHELGNGLQGCRDIEYCRTGDIELSEKLVSSYKRICKYIELVSVQAGLTSRKFFNSAHHRFTDEEREILEYNDTGTEIEINLEKTKTRMIKNIQEVREYAAKFLEEIGELRTDDERAYSREYSRVKDLLPLLCDSLENLCNGTVNDSGYKKKTKVMDSEKLSEMSVLHKLVLFQDIAIQTVEITEEARSSSVLFNPIMGILVFTNICSNAERAAKAKDVKLEFKIKIEKIADKIVFELTDNGIGMDDETMTKLNLGVQVSTKTDEGEHGIGFNYCRMMAEEMDGKLYVKESTVGVGTTVVLELQIAA